MSQSQTTVVASSRLQAIFHAAVKSYQKETKTELFTHPLTSQLQSCDSTSAILAILQDQVREFDKSRSGDERLTKWLSPTVNVLTAFSATVAGGVGLVFSPANVIFAGIGVFVQVTNDVAASKDVLAELFERIGYFFTRLETYTEVAPTAVMTDTIMQIMVEVINIFGIATKELRRGSTKKFLRKLAGMTALEDALKKLDRLTKELQKEAQVANAMVLMFSDSIDDKVTDVGYEVQAVVNKVQTINETQLARDVHRWFSPPDPSTNYNTACEAHQEGSSGWFLQGEKFREWMSIGSLLWIHGKPGSGKTILCSAIIKEVMPLRDTGQASLAFFYFDFRDEGKKYLRSFVTCLLVQLSTHSIPCREVISRIYSTHGDGMQQPSIHALTNCLREMLSVATHGPTYIVVDALDECPDSSGMQTPREDVLNLLEDLVRLRLETLRICVTSRPDIDIKTVLEPLASAIVSLQDEHGQKEDILNYVRIVVHSDKKMRRWRSDEKELVAELLSERADGMFLWVSCQLQALRYCPPTGVRQILNQVPEALAETYERALHQIPQAIQSQAYRMLQYLVAAVRLLRVEELAELLAFESDAVQGGIPKYGAADDQTQTVLSTCSSLVIVVDDSEPWGDRQVVQFSHFSVKEFLTSNRLASSVGDISRYHVHLLTAHTILTQACLGLLLNDHVDQNRFPLAEYAARCWTEHAKFDDVASHVKDEMETLFDPDKPHFATWIGIYDIDRPEIYDRNFPGSEISPDPTPNPLYYAALCGFYDLVKHLTNEHPQYVNVIGGRYGFPLLAALSQHHVNVAELLLAGGANIDLRETTGKTILLKALSQPQRHMLHIMMFLLDHGADVKIRDDTYRGPLHYLAEYGGEPEVAQILLDHGANVSSQDINGKTPLHVLLECQTNDEDNVLNHARLLLDYGAEVNTRDNDNQTPLLLAMQGNWFKLARILLDRGADPNDDKVKAIDIDQKVEGVNEWVKHDDINVETIDDTIRHRGVDSKEQGPPSLASLSITPPTAVRGRLRSFGARELSPVRDSATNATQPVISIKHATPQSTTGASTRVPAAGPATSAPAQFSFATLTPSRSPAFPAGVTDKKADGDGAIAPSSTWWNNLKKRKRMNPIEKAEGYARTRSRAIEAIGGALGTAASIGHEVLFTGVDLLQFAPVPGLDVAGNILLSIWDAVEMVETNRLASLRLIERCANILISIRGEIADAGYTVAEELGAPIEKLVKAFEEVRSCLNKLGQSPFLKRYLKRDEILSNISACDTSLNDAREAFNSSVQIRILKLVKELQQKEMLESLPHASPSLAPVRFFLPSAARPSPPADTESVRDTLHAVRAEQNAQDRAHDMADLHQLMLTALAANDDIAMIEVLQIVRSEIPDAIKTLERALEHLVEDQQVDAEESTPALPFQEEAVNDNSPSLESGNTGASHSSADPLDREFIVTGIDALRRLSKGTDLGLPSWTITQFEVELEEKVGFGSFSEVFRGTWRKHTVAVKVLDKTTPRKIFLREVKIWKSLYHPNVLRLFGASSASGEPPWFLVCKYYPQGNLVKYLKGLSDADAARIDAVRMMYEISKGMAYLHDQDVLHGDLKAANILVDDDTTCVISDFGQSEMKSEVYRLTRASQPRGTLRWQAPELMEGAQIPRPEMDVYAFGICCWEILNMGAVPWRLTDESTIRHLVLNKNMRPELPPPNRVSGHLINLIRLSWDRIPSKRPSFEIIARELKKQRAGRAP